MVARVPRWPWMSIVLVLVAMACGGNDEDAASTATVGSAAEPGGTAPVTDQVPPAAGPAGDSDFCSDLPDLAGFDASTVDITQPDGARAWVTGLVAVMSEVRAGAPAEIRDDVGVMLDGFEQLAAALEAADYDFLTADLSILEAPGFAAAGERVGDYYSDRCGLTIDVAPPGGAGPGLVPGGDFGADDADFRLFITAAYGRFLDDDQVDCLAASTTMELFATDPAGFMEACGIDPEQFGL